MPAASLPHRSLITLTGPDAQDFLHGIITTDVEGLPAGEYRPGALLTPQGKILFDFLIARTEDGFVLEVDHGQRDALLRRLAMYKLRAKVDITPGTEGVTVAWGDDAAAAEGIVDAAFGKAGILLKHQPGLHGHDAESAYDLLRIEAGLAISGKDFALQDAFPHDVLLDLDGGLSFRKGCYVGQEVVSRMQHRGTARRRVVQVSASQPLPITGTEIVAGGKPLGTLGTVVENKALAIVRIDRVGDAVARGLAISAGDVEVQLMLPAWTGLQFPTDAQEAET